MKSFEELEEYIKTQAIEHSAAEEEWEYDTIELETFREILIFAISEDFKVNNFNFDFIINGVSEDDDKTIWDYMYELEDVMDEMADKNELPPKTMYLYNLWKKEFAWK